MTFGPKINIEEVIKGCIENERNAQEILYKKYFPTMMSMTHRYTQDPDKAMDIVNNGFLRVFKKIHLYKNQGSLEGWIRRLIFHALSDYFRSKKSSVKFMVLEDYNLNDQTSSHDQLYYDDLMKLVEGLPNMTKNVFVKYAIEGFNHREIGKIYDISEGTSKWHLSNARKILIERIAKQSELNKYAK